MGIVIYRNGLPAYSAESLERAVDLAEDSDPLRFTSDEKVKLAAGLPFVKEGNWWMAQAEEIEAVEAKEWEHED